ncbi:MAG TPA: PA14 domain-containing protein [Anaerolineae bacterium]
MQRVYTPNNQKKKGPGRIAWWIVIATVVAILLGTLSVLLLFIPVTRTTEPEPTRAFVAGLPTQDTPLPATSQPTAMATETAVVESPTAVPTTVTAAPTTATATLPLPSATPVPSQAAPTQPPVILPTTTSLPPTALPATWLGEYFNNPNLVGSPVLVRNDANLAFDWGTAAPAAGLSGDSFSARWQRTLYFNAGNYRFHVRSDDGVRVWLDNQLIIDQWHDATNTTYSVDRSLAAGNHMLQVAYYEHGGEARIQFWWEAVGQFPEWQAEFFANATLSGAPALVRNDVNLDFNWGRSAPASGLPTDDFSARWTRTLRFDEGRYRFHALVDDGMRLYVDNTLVIDQWRDDSLREVTADLNLSGGNHALRVDYYEHGGDARIRVWWERIGATGYPDWKGEYWNNREFKGQPVLLRNDTRIDFNWEFDAPDPALPADNFAARWSRQMNLEAGTYRFYAIADDGIRVYVNGSRIIDQWHASGADRTYQADVALTAGNHLVVIEYYENQFSAKVKVWLERVDNLPAPTATSSPTPTQPPTTVATATASPTATEPSTAVPTATATVSATPTSSPTPTLPPTATATSQPTDTPAPTATASPTATSSPPPVPVAEIVLTPKMGSANTRVTVAGRGFPAQTAIQIRLGRPGQAPYTESYAAGQTNSKGKINIIFTMPATWPDGTAITEDIVMVYATTADSQVSALDEFAYVPAAEPGLALNPDQGNLGARVTATGSGFPAGQHVNLYLRTPDDGGDGASYGEATTNSKGNFVITFTVPSIWSDGSPITGDSLRVVGVTDDNSIRARSIFTLLGTVWEQAGYFVQ